MESGNGVLIERSLDINPTATLAIAQHNALSPLLKLPLEVKNHIYRYTFGGNVIHITQNSNGGEARFKSTICRALVSEEEAQESFNDDIMSKWNAAVDMGRHNCCRSSTVSSRARDPWPRKVNLIPLRCCRQIYNEAHHIPYSTNTFAFHNAKTLQSFVLSLTQGDHDNHLAIRSLLLEMIYANHDNGESWKKALATCAMHLRTLQNVNISIDWRNNHFTMGPRNRAELEKKGPFWRPDLISSVLVLKKLPLKTATMVISDQRAEALTRDPPSSLLQYSMDHEAKCRWTLEEKQGWSRYVRKAFLQNNR